MQVILLDKIRGLGDLGDTVDVKPGFGRNYLVPSRKAVFATESNRTIFEQKRAEHERQATERLAEAEAAATKIRAMRFEIHVLASGEGKLYGSVGINEIAQCLEKQGHTVPKKDIQLPEGMIHNVGRYPVVFNLHSDVIVEMTVNVTSGDSTSDDADDINDDQQDSTEVVDQ